MTSPARLKTDVFGLQYCLLDTFGFAPSSPSCRTNKCNAIKQIIGLSIILAGLAEIAYQCAVLTCAVSRPATDDDVILIGLEYGPFIAAALRGIVVLILVKLKRQHWHRLETLADEIVNEVFPVSSERMSRLRRWKWFARCFGIGTVVLHLGWEIGEYMTADIHSRSVERKSNHTIFVKTNPCMMEYYGTDLYIITGIIESVPFYLSQQIFTIVIILAFVLREGSKKLNRDIQELNEDLDLKRRTEHSIELGWIQYADRRRDSQISQSSELLMLSTKISNFQNFHVRLLRLSHEINYVFGWILFICYSMDAVALTGYVALIMTQDNLQSADLTVYLCSIVTFGAFVTLFYVPLVQAHEQATKVTCNLRFLIGAAAKLKYMKHHLRRRLELLCSATTKHVVIFEGAGLLHITRLFIVTSCTMTLSIAVLCYEVLNFHEETHGHHQCNKTYDSKFTM